jgi:hypothetical protein
MPVPSLMDVPKNDKNIYYTIDPVTHNIIVGPSYIVGKSIRVRYGIVPTGGTAMPTTIDGTTGDTFAGWVVPDRYRHILSYRVALRAAIVVEAPQTVFDMCSKAASALYDSMMNEHQIYHTQQPFQLGGIDSESGKYTPWFRFI